MNVAVFVDGDGRHTANIEGLGAGIAQTPTRAFQFAVDVGIVAVMRDAKEDRRRRVTTEGDHHVASAGEVVALAKDEPAVRCGR